MTLTWSCSLALSLPPPPPLHHTQSHYKHHVRLLPLPATPPRVAADLFVVSPPSPDVARTNRFWQEESSQATAYNKVQNEQPHEASWSHELIAGAAAFEAQKAYLDHKEKNGQPENHEVAKELLSAFAAAATDRLIETKGLDFIDREKAKHEAKRQAEEAVRPDYY